MVFHCSPFLCGVGAPSGSDGCSSRGATKFGINTAGYRLPQVADFAINYFKVRVRGQLNQSVYFVPSG